MLDATERRALMLTTFTASCICFAPAEIITGVLLLLVSGLLYRWDQAMLRKEAEAANMGGTPIPPAAAPPADASRVPE
jgi:uncharacterized membrane protein